jgi:chromosome segregation ATPase
VTQDIEQCLAEATAALREFHATQRLVAQLRTRMDEAADELAVLRNREDAEQADVDALERPSLTRLLSAFRAGRAETLERERAEAETARYQVAEAKARFDAVRAEHLAARDRLTTLERAPAAYEAALAAKERHLAESGDPRGQALLANAEHRGRIEGELREVRQASGAADNAYQYLDQLRDRINKATLVSAFDALSPGRSAIESQVIPELLDRVAEDGIHAAEWLVSLRNELADVDEPMPDLPDVTVRIPKFASELHVNSIPILHTMTTAIMKAGHNASAAMTTVDQLRTRLLHREQTLLTALAEATRARDSLHS